MDTGVRVVRGAFIVAAVWALAAPAAWAEVTIETLPVGNTGNTGEWSGSSYDGYGTDRICGAVDYKYRIGKYEVTAGQYTEFLNKVAGTDKYELYDPNMWSSDYHGCKIERTDTGSGYSYSVAADWANRPVNWVSFWDACRFANWLHNGQPTGAQGAGTTETGAYTLNGYNGPDGRTIQRNAGWQWAVTSEDEWYKAAYHKNDGDTGNYFAYPTSSNTAPGYVDDDGELSGTSIAFVDGVADPGNYATYDGDGGTNGIGSPYYRTEAGEWENSESPYGTFDQGGNVYELNEAVMYPGTDWTHRGLRGGSFGWSAANLHASYRYNSYPDSGSPYIGFRVSEVPEPASMAMLALGGLGMLIRRRRAGR